MKTEDILNILSDININSETAGEAVELYVKFMYFEKIIDFLVGLCFVGMIAGLALFILKLAKEEL